MRTRRSITTAWGLRAVAVETADRAAGGACRAARGNRPHNSGRKQIAALRGRMDVTAARRQRDEEPGGTRTAAGRQRVCPPGVEARADQDAEMGRGVNHRVVEKDRASGVVVVQRVVRERDDEARIAGAA